MSLEFIDDMARGSRWWDAVGRYDVHGDVDMSDVSKEKSPHVEREAPYGEALVRFQRSDVIVVDAPITPVSSGEQDSSVGVNAVPLTIWLEDALTNGCSSPFIDD
jgi:hypothetical protein